MYVIVYIFSSRVTWTFVLVIRIQFKISMQTFSIFIPTGKTLTMHRRKKSGGCLDQRRTSRSSTKSAEFSRSFWGTPLDLTWAFSCSDCRFACNPLLMKARCDLPDMSSACVLLPLFCTRVLVSTDTLDCFTLIWKENDRLRRAFC